MTLQQSNIPPTPPTPSDKLEQLLTSHLTVALEPQRGRALAAFRAQLVVAQQEAPAPIPISRGVVPKRALWYWAGVPSLVAASLAVVVTLQMVNRPTAQTLRPGGDNPLLSSPVGAGLGPSPSGTIVFDQQELSHELNGGMVVLDDNTPVRVVRRQATRQTRWIDPKDKAVYSLTEEPIEKVGYTRIQPY